jgi:dihydrofolate reductase
LGRTTYEQYKGEIYPVPGVINVVLTSNPADFREHQTDSLLFLSGEPQTVLKQLAAEDINTVLLVGGGDTNAKFAAAGLIDDVILDVHPVLLGDGKRLFGDYTAQLDLQHVQTKQHDGFTQIRARVTKPN